MITFFTIVLNGMPWIQHHYPVFRSLSVPWRWIVCEGVAANVNCTKWCAKIPPQLSDDGTGDYLGGLWLQDRRIMICSLPLWEGGKVEMCNLAASAAGPGLLWEVDADELWTKVQIEAVYRAMMRSNYNTAMFYCRYWVGPQHVVINRECYGNNTAYEWKRVWKFTPGMSFHTHEPPVMLGLGMERTMRHKQTEDLGAVFEHPAYATLEQIRFKARYYSGSGNPVGDLYLRAEEGFNRLCANERWPAKLTDFYPWVDDRALVCKIPEKALDLICKEPTVPA